MSTIRKVIPSSPLSSSDDEDEGSVDPAEALFQRGSYLRSLRELERQDEAERRSQQQQHNSPSNSETKDDSITLPSSPRSKESTNTKDSSTNGEVVQIRLLQYDRYLEHQRYHDDLKHVDCHYIEYSVLASTSSNPNNNSNNNNESKNDTDAETPDELSSSLTPPPVRLPLIVEQDKSLGKGGLCWDAAFILAEYLAAHHSWEWLQHNNDNNNSKPMRILELGAGTGLCGLYLAKHLSYVLSNNHNYQSNNHNIEMALTDLPQLLPLLQRNVDRNFATSLYDNTAANNTEKEIILQEYLADTTATNHGTNHPSGCKVTASILPWGDAPAEAQHGEFDVVLGADVVASLYDPVALAQCLYRMVRSSNDNNNNNNDNDGQVYIAYKERLSTQHRQFEAELARWFTTVTVVDPLLLVPASSCRNRNPDVKILVARGKRTESN